MVCVKSQDVKLKRMKYHDPFLWGNVLKGFYSFQGQSGSEGTTGGFHGTSADCTGLET